MITRATGSDTFACPVVGHQRVEGDDGSASIIANLSAPTPSAIIA